MNLTLKEIQYWITLADKTYSNKQLVDYCGVYYSPYYSFMNFAANYLKNNGLYVELGCEKGRGLYALALSGNRVLGLDTVRRSQIATVQSLFSNIIFLEQASLPLPEWFDYNDDKIAILHIDTEHSYGMAKAEFETYKPRLLNNALVIFDDLHAMDDGVLSYFESLPYPKIQDDRMHPTCGWGCLIYDANT